MSIIKEINELNFIIKFILLNIILTAPFFYIDIYFLTNNIFNKAPIYIPIITSICMSICWYYSSTIVLALFDRSNYNTDKEIQQQHTMFTLGSVISISIISIFSLYFKMTFRNFFHVCAFSVIIFFILAILLPKKNKKATK